MEGKWLVFGDGFRLREGTVDMFFSFFFLFLLRGGEA